MRNRKKQKGFTLIEVVVALLIFSILMGCLWEFYANVYKTYAQFDNNTNLENEARRVSSFIREEIRLSDKVTLEAADGTLINPPKTTSPCILIKDAQLKSIYLITSGAGMREPDHSIVLKGNPRDKNKGDYMLVYRANGTDSTIADKIKNIKITREEDSPIVQFECTVGRQGGASSSVEVKNIFSESLEYKEAYKIK